MPRHQMPMPVKILYAGVLVFLSPFSPALWIVIACTPFFVAAMLTLMAKLTPLGIYNIIRTRQVSHHGSGHPMEEHAVEAGAVQIFLISCYAGGFPQPTHSSPNNSQHTLKADAPCMS